MRIVEHVRGRAFSDDIGIRGGGLFFGDAELTVAPHPSQVGEALWRARLRLGLSLDEAARRIGSNAALLGALESSDPATLARGPGMASIVGAYARLLGLPSRWAMRTWTREAEEWRDGKG